tara:strand:+ start:3074 stop:3775 length:702 start_codon:yes stop_codon:yes gene_type:complete
MDQSTQDKIWDYWQTTGIKAFTSNTGRLDYVGRLVTRFGKSKVLTIGVGDLYLEKILLKNRMDLYVLDPSQTSISSATQSLSLDSERAIVGYSQNMPYESDFFDVIVMSEVLEHLDDDILSGTIKELHRVLKKGGRFIGTVPFNENLKKSEVMCPHCDAVFHKVGHVRSFDKLSMLNTLKSCFNESDIKIWIKFLPAWKILNFKGKLVASLKKILEFFSIYGEKFNLIVIATK